MAGFKYKWIMEQPEAEGQPPTKKQRTSELTDCFVDQFISSRGNEYFCEIDEEYLTDRFNLTGLNTEVQYYQYALDLITDVFDVDCDDDMREAIEKAARHLYGLVHARYIVTTRGLGKMVSSRFSGPCVMQAPAHAHAHARDQASIPILRQSRTNKTLNSSRSTRRPTLESAPASTATPTPSCPWVSPTYPT